MIQVHIQVGNKLKHTKELDTLYDTICVRFESPYCSSLMFVMHMYVVRRDSDLFVVHNFQAPFLQHIAKTTKISYSCVDLMK